MNTFSKQLSLTDTTNGHLIYYADFSLTDENAVFKFLQIVRVSTVTMSIKFSLNDDWILIPSYPYTFDSIRFEAIWMKPSISLTVDLISSFIPENYMVS